jgi:hypothetical protein
LSCRFIIINVEANIISSSVGCVQFIDSLQLDIAETPELLLCNENNWPVDTKLLTNVELLLIIHVNTKK